MARRSMGVADIKEILVQWDAGEGVSRIARSLGYTRPTVRKYIRAAQEVGLRRGSRQYGEAEWERLARDAVASVAVPLGHGQQRLGASHVRGRLRARAAYLLQ